MRFEVSVPASSANLGPGFDVLALALGWYLVARYETDGLPGSVRVATTPELHGGPNLVLEAMQALVRESGLTLPGGVLNVASDIPVARGLGSSAAAVVAGLVLANELLGRPCEESTLFRLACSLEGHGDNVGAALFGGAVLAVEGINGPLAVRIPIASPLVAVVLVPDALGFTSDARAVLPRRIRRVTAVRTAARTALLVLALSTGRAELLATAMLDELHQPYRAVLYPHLEETIKVAQEAGAYGAALSGAGPSVLALVHPRRAEAVRRALEELIARRGLAARAVILPIDEQGARVIREVELERSGVHDPSSAGE
ncbi:homoserine kinase [Thermomicrobium sp. CFH 73360]|uniref:homoserine kinase n=1 Tax=Thermomicrobium sp. CFH 73360 TaxID=2951987 RepID=UPI002076AF21|nr:homoserine kinase [Thermomicrobium sp. CFH 73360]MCM8745129.1 homoserine kinase [Thermomicrobium sp. CFH 73360]